MKIKNISKIKGYKSYKLFKINNLDFNDKLNIFFGENGNWKSSLIDIFKNLSDNKNFEINPEKVFLKIDQEDYKFENGSWNKEVEKENFIFFDDDFIARNIHLNKERIGTQWWQAQNSSKLFISVDEKAIYLKNLEDEEKIKKEDLEKEKRKLEDENEILLKKDFQKFQKEFDSFDKLEILNELKEDNLKILNEENNYKKDLEKNKKDLKNIKDLILDKKFFIKKEIDLKEFKDNLENFLKFNIEESKIEESKKVFSDYIKDNKKFFEKGFELRGKQEDKKCPFCLSKNEEESIKNILELKNKIFDDVYITELEKFNNLKNEIKQFLENLDKNISFQDFFNELEKINKDFQIKDFYKIEEKNIFKNFKLENVEPLEKEIENINEKNNKDFELKKLKKFLVDIDHLNNIIKKFNKILEEKGVVLKKFKEDNSDEKIWENLEKVVKKINDLEFKKEFFENFKDIKKFFEIKNDILAKEEKIEAQKKKYNLAKEDSKNYYSEDIFKDKVEKISEYLKKFNLNFKLEFEKKSGNQEVMPFVFIIKDKDWNERSISDWISNWELQAISISFFLSFLDSQNLENKIIFFDDPVSSLDNSNLKNFVDLLSEKEFIENNQTFIFSHHLTFFKFLSKKFKENKGEFLILKNKKELWGSFYCKFFKENLFDKLVNFSSDQIENIQIHNRYAYESKIIEYWQILRYEVEKFIKNDLLRWNESYNFSQIVDWLKVNSLEGKDLIKIKSIYNFCNWTNSHVDIWEPSSLNDLKQNIEDFVEIKERIKN